MSGGALLMFGVQSGTIDSCIFNSNNALILNTQSNAVFNNATFYRHLSTTYLTLSVQDSLFMGNVPLSSFVINPTNGTHGSGTNL